MITPASSAVRFGSFELDLHSGELRKDGLKIRLADQPLQVLTLLLEHPGEVVTREELQRKLWSSDTFVEFEHSLNAAVKRLREALGDSAENPRYVETLPRHGYRFIAPLGSIDRSPVEPVARDRSEPTPTQKRRRWAIAIALLVVATASYPVDRWIWQRWHHSDVPIRAIAMLPLENFSNDPSEEYFSDGMTEALITELGHARALRVISRQSVIHFKGTTKTVPQIGDELQVDALVEGSALREGDKVRISVQLVRVKPEEHLWAQSYERDFRDVIALQREVSHAIVSEIQGTLLTSEERTRLAGARPVNPDAYQAYLKGRFFWNKRTQLGMQAACTHFEQALALDPAFAPAYSGLADCITLSSEPGYDLVSFQEAKARTRPLVMKALELDPNLAEAHASLGYQLGKFDGDEAGAEREIRRAIELDPNNVFARHRLYGMLFHRGLTEEALAENRRALAIDPLSPLLHSARAYALQFMRRDDEALRELQAALEVDPDFVMAHIQRALFFERHGKLLEAIHDWEFDDEGHYGPEKAHQWAEQSREGLQNSGASGYWAVQISRLQEYAKDGVTVRPLYFARAYAYRGDRDRALEWLSKPGGPGRTDLLYNPDWDSLRTDPRFQELQKAHATQK